MKETPERQEKRKGLPLLFSIIIVFCIFGTIVFSVSRRLSSEMSQAAIQNLSESLDLLQSTIEAILHNEAEFQKLIAQEIARVEDPEDYIRAFERNQTMAKLSFIPSGSAEGVSNTGERFTEEGLDFSAGGTVMGNTRIPAGFPVLCELYGDMVLHHEVPGGAERAGGWDPVRRVYL